MYTDCGKSKKVHSRCLYSFFLFFFPSFYIYGGCSGLMWLQVASELLLACLYRLC